jgi:hypothetical protein
VPGFSTGPPLVFTGYFAASNSARISSVGAGVTRLTTTQTVSIWLSAVDIVAARMPARTSLARQCLPVRMKKMMKTKKMTDYFAASGKMILFTKKKMTIEMPPLSTVVPML